MGFRWVNSDALAFASATVAGVAVQQGLQFLSDYHDGAAEIARVLSPMVLSSASRGPATTAARSSAISIRSLRLPVLPTPRWERARSFDRRRVVVPADVPALVPLGTSSTTTDLTATRPAPWPSWWFGSWSATKACGSRQPKSSCEPPDRARNRTEVRPLQELNHTIVDRRLAVTIERSKVAERTLDYEISL